jgi:hypothetical protein
LTEETSTISNNIGVVGSRVLPLSNIESIGTPEAEDNSHKTAIRVGRARWLSAIGKNAYRNGDVSVGALKSRIIQSLQK